MEVKDEQNLITIEPKSEKTEWVEPNKTTSDQCVKGAAAVPTLALKSDGFQLPKDDD